LSWFRTPLLGGVPLARRLVMVRCQRGALALLLSIGACNPSVPPAREPPRLAFCEAAEGCAASAGEVADVDECVDNHEDAEAAAARAGCADAYADHVACRLEAATCDEATGFLAAPCPETFTALGACLLDDDDPDQALTSLAWLVCEASYRCEQLDDGAGALDPRFCAYSARTQFELALEEGCFDELWPVLQCSYADDTACTDSTYGAQDTYEGYLGDCPERLDDYSSCAYGANYTD